MEASCPTSVPPQCSSGDLSSLVSGRTGEAVEAAKDYVVGKVWCLNPFPILEPEEGSEHPHDSVSRAPIIRPRFREAQGLLPCGLGLPSGLPSWPGTCSVQSCWALSVTEGHRERSFAGLRDGDEFHFS